MPSDLSEFDEKHDSSSFTSQSDLCGSALLDIICGGHVIIKTILELSNQVPSPILSASTLDSETMNKTRLNKAKKQSTGTWMFASSSPSKNVIKNNLAESIPSNTSYLIDFTYLDDPERYDSQDIGNIKKLDQLEQNFQTMYKPILIKFHQLFHRIYSYQVDLVRFASELEKGYFVQHSVESVLLDTIGQRLLCEAVYIWGTMLILIELYLPGPVRERLIIAHHRYYCDSSKNRKSQSSLEDLCKLFSRTPDRTKNESQKYNQALSPKKRPIVHEDLFTRFLLPSNLIKNVIGCLLSNDIYCRAPCFPNFDHRSNRLSNQSCMIFVVLYMDLNVLKEEGNKMRIVVDKFFYDNWRLTLYDGTVVDLSVEWNARFPAANSAIGGLVLHKNVTSLTLKNDCLIQECTEKLKIYQGKNCNTLTEEYVLDNENELLDCMRCTNVAIRWRILHHTFSNEAIDTSSDKVITMKLVNLILMSSQFEFDLKEKFKQLLTSKNKICRTARKIAKKNMTELSQYFHGKTQAFVEKVQTNVDLANWFAGMANEIQLLTFESNEHFTVMGRKIQLCIQALDDVEKFELIDQNLQVKKVLKETKLALFHIVRVVSIKDDICFRVDSISEFFYGRKLIKKYVSAFHSQILRNPNNVGQLRALFLKLKSILVTPTTRLLQHGNMSNEFSALIHYYSESIVEFVRDILDIIPISMFSTLKRIVDIQEKKLMSLPSKVEVDSLDAYSQLNDRSKLAKITYELSILSEGILGMDVTMMGKIQIVPRNFLEIGFRKELVRQVTLVFHHNLQFGKLNLKDSDSVNKYRANMIKSLSNLASRMNGFRKSIEYIQDFIGVDGLSIFLEEVTWILGYNTGQEVNKYAKDKKNSLGELKSYEILSRIPESNAEELMPNFMGRTMTALLKLTDPRISIYSKKFSGWFCSDGEENCGSKLISLLCQGITPNGICSLDKLLNARCMNELHRFFYFYNTTVKKYGATLEQIQDKLSPQWEEPKDGGEYYHDAIKQTDKLMTPLMTFFCRVGQLQLLVVMLRNELQLCAGVDAKKLVASARTLNIALMNQLMSRGSMMENISSNLLIDFSDILTSVGIGNPISTFFSETDPLEGLPILLTLFVISSSSKFIYDSDFGSMVQKEKGSIDGWPMIVGISTLLKQFHPSYTKDMLSLLGQFVRCILLTNIKNSRKTDLPSVKSLAIKNVLIIVRNLCSISKLSDISLSKYFPEHVLEMYS